MRIYLDQIGCRLNYSEIETLAQRFQAVGHQTVHSPEHAQVIVFNTCAVTTEAGSKSRQRIRQLHTSNPAARIAVTGCWATLEPKKAKKLPGVALVADNTRKDLLHTLLEPWSAECDDPAVLTHIQPDGNPFASLADGTAHERKRRTRAFVKVQDGCDNRCTFCVVTIARGQSRSRTVTSVVDEIQSLAESGVQEAVLTGVHLGGYGRDLCGGDRTDLKELTAAILQDTDVTRLRLSSLEPWELADDFFELWDKWPGRLCSHLHLPLQAGTDAQLRRMARRCTVESYGRLVQDARSAIPDLVLTTDLIVGFPGESEKEFEEGLSFVEEIGFVHAHVFPYSARPGTAAAAFDGQIPSSVQKERARRVVRVVERTGSAIRQQFVGTQRQVLWENAKQDLSDTPDRLWTGFTDNYLRVAVQAPRQADLANKLFVVSLNELHGDTFFGTIFHKQ